nr:PREDICTED: uncharacterized protein LOC109036533 [Bemisia tabaci]
MNFSSGKKNKEPYILIDKNFNPKDACKKLTELARVSKNFPVIGLDCEWAQSKGPCLLTAEVDEVRSNHHLLSAARVPNIRHPVAILQLATKDNPVLIIRLSQIIALEDDHLDWQIFFIRLKDLLNSAEVLKVGVSIQTDTSHLFYDYNLYTVNCLDLQHIAAHYEYPKSGLTYLAKRLLNVDLPRFAAWRTDWDGPVLSPEALKYAADDAKMAVLIFEKFLEQSIQETKKSSKPVKNCADFIKLWRYKIDVIYRYRCPPDPNEQKIKDGEADTSGDTADVEADSTTILPPIHASPSRLALHNQKDDDRNMEYRTSATETENTKSHPKMSFYKLILIMNIIVILLAVFIIFKLVLGR